MSESKNHLNRRQFISKSAKTAAVVAAVTGFPTIVPSSVFGKHAPSNRINVGAIGAGRISRSHDMPGVWKFDTAQIMAVCDLDQKRAAEGQVLVNEFYSKKYGKPYAGVKTYNDYRELLANKDVDAVLISTPDHWHARIAVDAV